MSDIDWTNDFELQGQARADAISAALDTIAGWGLVMPDFNPMPLHFGLHDWDNIGETEWWIVNDTTNNYCGKFLFLFDGQRCPEHHHKIKDETFYIVRGDVEMTIDGNSTILHPGDVLQVSPGQRHTFAAHGGPCLVLEVSLPSISGDNIFVDTRIGNNGVL